MLPDPCAVPERAVKWITDIIPQARDLVKVLGVLEYYISRAAAAAGDGASASGANVVVGPVYDYATDGARDDPDDLRKFWEVGRQVERSQTKEY